MDRFLNTETINETWNMIILKTDVGKQKIKR